MKPVKVIPSLDIADGRVVKGVKFENMKDVGDPAEIAQNYWREGADALVFMDISATVEQRKMNFAMLERAAKSIDIPVIFGGGVNSMSDVDQVMSIGLSKCSINSGAVKDPTLIARAAEKYGSKKIVLAIDCKRNSNGRYDVVTSSGKFNSHIDTVEWAKKAEALGAGEILLTNTDRDGTNEGYNLEIIKAVTEAVNIRVIASGGAGKLEHFAEAVLEGGARSVLAASVFHYGTLTVGQVKEYLVSRGIPVRER